ncbi:CYTH domain-containing protein [Paenibacillus humicola]|uniref:CYTH domain-containing protein n=1 Tax=Paenibacillus humicola TaxID=3110540 RepID=UPI00237B5B22|nr:CYTH domain-containing protein [Paenibacillus humicola]
MALEIERKFLLDGFPETPIRDGELEPLMEQRIEQTYLAIDGDEELRIRKITDVRSGRTTYTHTFKKGTGLSREEIEYEISAGIYEQIAEAHDAVALTKNRTTAKWNGWTVEIDRYDQLELTVVEVEFGSEVEASAFVPPEWFGRDISRSRPYSNKTVWRELQRKAAASAAAKGDAPS